MLVEKYINIETRLYCERRMMYILFYINKIPPAHSFFVKMKIIVEVKKVGKLPSLGMPIEPKIMDGF